MRPHLPFLLILWLAPGSPAALAADVAVTLPAGDGFVVKDSAGTTERLRVDEATGNVSRNGALFVHTTGSATNLFVGALAGGASTTGAYNVAFGYGALAANTNGNANAAFGTSALRYNSSGDRNAAFGQHALFYNTASHNSAFGHFALASNTTGERNAAFGDLALFSNAIGSGNSAFGERALLGNTTGADNSGFGQDALAANLVGSENSGFGKQALAGNIGGTRNAALGVRALQSNDGDGNAAFGFEALRNNTSGDRNTAVGMETLKSNQGGAENVAVGGFALSDNTTGNRNIAIGHLAGIFQGTGSDNIYIASVASAGESGQIRIGTLGTHTKASIMGIHGNTSTSGIAVLVNGNGTLGTTTSSERFKRDVSDMGDASRMLMELRPVTFRYRKDGEQLQYGLIAEEVAEVAPELVALGAEGEPYSVRYHVLPALLLNEVQRDRRTIREQQRAIRALLDRVERLEARQAP